MDTTTFFQWPQDNIVREVENYNTKNATTTTCSRPQGLNCPRCKSNNTKFCYYNNYSVSQPRYLCKTCKRYWTQGGILRNVPMGGASRKNKKPSSQRKLIISSPLLDAQNLNSDFNPFICNGMSSGFFELNNHQSPNFCSSSFSQDLSDNSLVSMPLHHNSNPAISSSAGFYDDYNMMDDIKPSFSLTHDNIGLEINGNCGNNNLQENITSSSRIIFPFDEELNPVSTCDYDNDQFGQLQVLSQGDSSRCYRNYGMVNGGSSQLDVGLEWW